MVDLLNIQPLTFDESLPAVGSPLFDHYDDTEKEHQIDAIFHARLLDAYNYHLIIGGMPEGINSWIRCRGPAKVSRIQQKLIEMYENDLSKHNGAVNSGRILMASRSIVSQLAKSNKKFMYGSVRPGGRARGLERAIEWLASAGMLNRVYKGPLTENYVLQKLRGQFPVERRYWARAVRSISWSSTAPRSSP